MSASRREVVVETKESKAMKAALLRGRFADTEAMRAHAFVENACESRDCGFELVCVECGRGETEEEHEDWCTAPARAAAAEKELDERIAKIMARDDA